MADLRTTIFQALTGQRGGDVTGRGDLLSQLRTIGGSSTRTRSGVDLTRAAERLKVSRRTVERWAKTAATGSGQKPSAGHGRTLSKLSRQAASTKAGRRGALQAARGAVGPAGKRITVSGSQGPRRTGTDYVRTRDTTLTLSPDDSQTMFDAYEQGGEQGFMGWIQQHWSDNYLDGWEIPQLDGLTVETPRREY